MATVGGYIEKGEEPDADDLEEQEMLFLSRAEVEAAVARGAFKVLPWQTLMALALFCEAEYPAACCVGSMDKAKPDPKEKIW